MKHFQTTHNLDFEIADWRWDKDLQQFRIGTVEGLWMSTPTEYKIIAVTNREPGNGHLDDMFEWFENSCRRDGLSLRICEVWNKRFKKHLLKKGFIKKKKDVIKHY